MGNDQFQIRKGFTASELFSGFLDPDKVQDTTAVQRRRFVAVPRHAGKGLLASRATPKNHCSASPSSKIVE
jgi:hypothetical protein